MRLSLTPLQDTRAKMRLFIFHQLDTWVNRSNNNDKQEKKEEKKASFPCFKLHILLSLSLCV